YLRENYLAPQILIGHSLGGAAVLNAAQRVEESLAVVTIGAPADATHVSRQFECDVAEIVKKGKASVSLAGRPFTIKKQFLDDIAKSNTEQIGQLKKALLVMHSPLDSVVSIEQAEKIYVAAKHPKSFISLDKADHLVSNKDDAEYIAESIAAWVTHYLPGYQVLRKKTTGADKGKVIVNERNKEFTREVLSDSHFWLADEPVNFGGANLGPDPYEHLLAALGTCTSMTVRMYANRKGWPLESVSVELSHERKHGEDCEECETPNQKIEVLSRELSFTGGLSKEQTQRLIEIADKCPVHKTLEGELRISTHLKE
ncbi:MAG: bifunctional alpha/beta hydrolase/OsmC family protein, partial [Kangiellaceae bacterium]|nr:bifunctional alpha/beta hydrolase/OsmC family protein [Kangiellaceae bacterium]